jgi:hypothetical protein
MDILSQLPNGKTVISEIIEETEKFIKKLKIQDKDKIIEKIYEYENNHPLDILFKKFEFDYEKLQEELNKYKKQKISYLNSIISKK